MVRSLSCLMVICLVAATAVRSLDAAPDQRAAAPAAHLGLILHARLAPVPPPRRAAAFGPELPVAIVDGAPVVAPPVVATKGRLTEHRAAIVVILPTRSARGPPIV